MQERRPATLLETALRHEYRGTLFVLAGIALACWTWIVVMARDMYGTMLGPSAWMMTTIWDWPRILLLWAMWAAMMTAMMLPTATPLILLYAAAAPNAEPRSPARRVYALAAGYMLVWSLFSVLATARAADSLAGTGADANDGAGHAAGRRHRTCCRGGVSAHSVQTHLSPCVPIALCVHRAALAGWAAGAFRLGVHHGTYCLGCCWALMLILFAGGVMNLLVIVALTVWVILEKLAPFGEQTATGSGTVLLALAVWMILRGMS